MSGFGISMEVSKFFFDREGVRKKMGNANAKAMSKVGAFIRRRARTSLRRRKAVSEPGSPPSVHSTDGVATLKNILFAYDPSSQSLAVGPVKLNQQQQSWITMGNVTVPQLHEFGDVMVIREWSWNQGKTWTRQDLRVRHTSRKRKEVYNFIERRRRAIYKPRPFMAPALAAEQENIPKAWQGSLSQ